MRDFKGKGCDVNVGENKLPDESMNNIENINTIRIHKHKTQLKQ